MGASKRVSDESNNSSDEEDIWDYKSIKRAKKTRSPSCNGNMATPKVSTSKRTRKSVAPSERSLSQNGCSSTKTEVNQTNNDSAEDENASTKKKSKKKVLKTPIKCRPIHEGHCPFCQMPFSMLIVQSPRWHVTECMDLPLVAVQECPSGLQCDNTIESHFRKFRHTQLANKRSGMEESACRLDDVSSKPSSKSKVELFQSPSTDSAKRDRNNSPLPSLDPECFVLECDTNEDITQEKVKRKSDDSIQELIETAGNKQENRTEDIISYRLDNESDSESNCSEDLFPECSETTNQSNHLRPVDGAKQTLSPDKEPDCDINDILVSSSSKSDLDQISPSQTIVNNKNCTKQSTLSSFFRPLIKNQKRSNIVKMFSSNKKSTEPPKIKSDSSIVEQNGSETGVSKSLKRVNPATELSSSSAETSTNDAKINGFQRRNKKCPFYKKIPGAVVNKLTENAKDTSLTVDAFNYGEIEGCKAYILSHFHYDHYMGLRKRFNQQMYCSKVTANLVKLKFGLDPQYITILPVDTSTLVEGVKVTPMDANHCPGAVIFLFQLANGRTFLHTGDFRAHPSMEEYPALVGRKIHQLYLDTTYCDPSHAFPPQQEVIDFAITMATKAVDNNPFTLIVCGSYTIGKERVFMALAEALGSKVGVTKEKWKILNCLEDSSLSKHLSLDCNDSRIHLLPMSSLKPNALSEHLMKFSEYNSLLAFEPTGWTHSNKIISLEQIKPKYSRNGVTIYGIPYSEHSSFLEMKRFVQFINPDRVLPTVNNGNPAERKKMESLFHEWLMPAAASTFRKSQSSLGTWFKS